jgi:predicted RNase H-like nuclease (RuvC/YqgF family)
MKDIIDSIVFVYKHKKTGEIFARGRHTHQSTSRKKHRLDDDIAEAEAAIERLSKAIEEAEKNQFNPDWDAVQLLSDTNFALHRRIAELEEKLQEKNSGY